MHLSKELICKTIPAEWVFDTGATSSMTDQHYLFRGPLQKIKEINIQVGGGELFSNQRGIAMVLCQDGSSILLHNTLYFPNIGVSLVSAKQLCRHGMYGFFDEYEMYV